jgi:1-acyl-sn-glycerol-3-phosphate acyltransferase
VQWLASLLYTGFLFVSTPLFALYVILTAWLPFPLRYRNAQHWARMQLAVLRWLCGLSYVVEGREHLPPGSHVSLWKHSSTFEIIAQMVIFPPQAWVMKKEIRWIPLVGWAVLTMRPIAIDRKAGGSAVNQVLEQGAQRLASGLWVLVFPEGTRVAVGATKKFGLSGALLAVQSGCHIVPVAHDAGLYWPRRGLLKRRGTVRIIIGPAIATAGRDAREVNAQASAWINATVARLGA